MAKAIGQGYTILGLTDCPACAKEIPAKKTGGGKLSLSCAWCDLAVYVNAGTKAHALLAAKVRPLEPAASSSSSVTPIGVTAPPATEKTASEKKDPPPAPPRRGPLFGGT